jgi:ParB-like chromosome segregation protein Spo0J
MKKLKIHPAAGAFPMMPDDELDELAEDIKVNGLRHPIILNKEGQLVDG